MHSSSVKLFVVELVVCALAAMAPATQNPARIFRKVRIGVGDCLICASSSNHRRFLHDTESACGVTCICMHLSRPHRARPGGSLFDHPTVAQFDDPMAVGGVALRMG